MPTMSAADSHCGLGCFFHDGNIEGYILCFGVDIRIQSHRGAIILKRIFNRLENFAAVVCISAQNAAGRKYEHAAVPEMIAAGHETFGGVEIGFLDSVRISEGNIDVAATFREKSDRMTGSNE